MADLGRRGLLGSFPATPLILPVTRGLTPDDWRWALKLCEIDLRQVDNVSGPAMMILAADDVDFINARIAHEQGARAAFDGQPRTVPDECKNRAAWLEGFEEGRTAMTRTGANEYTGE